MDLSPKVLDKKKVAFISVWNDQYEALRVACFDKNDLISTQVPVFYV